MVDLLEKLLIVTLGQAGLPQREIRAIVEADGNRVSRILKHMKRASARGEVEL
jgi:hypothetical protein